MHKGYIKKDKKKIVWLKMLTQIIKQRTNKKSNHLSVQINVKRLASCLERSKIWGFPKFRRNSIPQSWKSNKQRIKVR